MTPKVRATKAKGTYLDGIHDYLCRRCGSTRRGAATSRCTSCVVGRQRRGGAACRRGRDQGDEAVRGGDDLEQRGQSVLETELAAAKILTFGLLRVDRDTATAGAVPLGLGRQRRGGDQLRRGDRQAARRQEGGVRRRRRQGPDPQVRRGVHRLVDYDLFVDDFKRVRRQDHRERRTIPDRQPDAIQAAAPTMITRMKEAGVTTIVLFAGSMQMPPLMENATKQDYFPEWFFTGASYQDIGILARNYPPEQSQHAFGISFIYAVDRADPAPATGMSTQKIDPLNWYWGPDAGHVHAALRPALGSLAAERHPRRRPEPHAEDVQAGPVRAPRRRWRGRGPHRQHHGRVRQGAEAALRRVRDDGYDFAPYWWDPDTEGPSNGFGTVGKGVGWYVDGGKRYVATTWPKKQFAWFDKSVSITASPAAPAGRSSTPATARTARRPVAPVSRARPATPWWCSRQEGPAPRPREWR